MSGHMELKQLRIPRLHNLILDAESVGRWDMRTYGRGYSAIPVTKQAALYTPECRTAFCAAGWGALEAGFTPVYAKGDGDSDKRFYLQEGYVPMGMIANVRGADFDKYQLQSAHGISREYYGLTRRESEFLFEDAAGVEDVDRFLHMLNIVKDGNPSDFDWLHLILNGGVRSPKAERYNLKNLTGVK